MAKPWTLSWHKDRLADDLRQADHVDVMLRAYAPCFDENHRICDDCCTPDDAERARRLLAAKLQFINNASYHRMMADKILEDRARVLAARGARLRSRRSA